MREVKCRCSTSTHAASLACLFAKTRASITQEEHCAPSMGEHDSAPRHTSVLAKMSRQAQATEEAAVGGAMWTASPELTRSVTRIWLRSQEMRVSKRARMKVCQIISRSRRCTLVRHSTRAMLSEGPKKRWMRVLPRTRSLQEIQQGLSLSPKSLLSCATER